MKKILFISLIGAACSTGCYYNSPSDAVGPLESPAIAAHSSTDAQILGAMMVLNRNEISAASLAQQKAAHPAVRKYAMWMSKEHSKNLQEMQQISQRLGVPPQESKVSNRLQNKGQEEMSKLSRLSGFAFDRAYMAAMVKGHQGALALLNLKIKEARNPVVRQALETTRGHVQAHLKQAERVQREI